MPVTISDEDYKLFRTLQNNYLFQKKMKSVRNMNNLKYDIDKPIRNIVSMLALLGHEPIFSCCGFDYEEQPIHKTHEYGKVFISLEMSMGLKDLVEELNKEGVVFEFNMDNRTDRWTFRLFKNRAFLESIFTQEWKDMGYPWANRSCLHFSELANIRINEMERVLYKRRDKFLTRTTLLDTNREYKEKMPSWQYPALKPWVIKKSDVLEVMNE